MPICAYTKIPATRQGDSQRSFDYKAVSVGVQLLLPLSISCLFTTSATTCTAVTSSSTYFLLRAIVSSSAH